MSYKQEREEIIGKLCFLGWRYGGVITLLRAATTLHRWAEEECNGTIQRDGDDGDGKPYRYFEMRNGEHVKSDRPIPDREKGAQERIRKVLPDGWQVEFGGDPRGCVVKVAPPDDSERYDDGSLRHGISIPGRY